MKRRKVGNMLALAVLSAVVDRPMHPYEMASVLQERGKDLDMKIKWGSLYTVVGNLEKHGFLSAVESVRDSGRPERTVYAITPAGRAELDDWVEELVGTVEREPPRFQAGLSLLLVLGPDRSMELLGRRLTELGRQIDAKQDALSRLRKEIPRLFLIEAEYDLALLEAEATWLRGFVDDVKTGSIQGVPEWRTWYETGELPGDLGEFAEKERVEGLGK